MIIGMNPDNSTYYTTGIPFINIYKLCEGYTTHNGTANTGQETQLELDDDGFPLSVTFGTTNRLSMAVHVNTLVAPYYESGRYVCVYEGEHTFTWAGDAVRNAGLSTAGREVFDVATPSNTGIRFFITSTGTPPNHGKIQYICHEDHEAALLAGQIWHPTFLERMAPFRAVRFMGMDRIIDGRTFTWDTRVKLADPFWCASYNFVYANSRRFISGVPIEAQIDLCNTLRATLNFNTHVCYTDEMELNAATLIKNTLDPRLKVTRESWNEQWNSFASSTAAQTLGAEFWPSSSGFAKGFYYHLYRTVAGGNIWRGVFGPKGTTSGDRFTSLLGVQAAFTGRVEDALKYACDGSDPGSDAATEMLWDGQVSEHVDGITGAPYYFQSSGLPEPWTNEPDGGLDKAFQEATVGGLVPSTTGAPTTGGTSTAYTLTSGLSLSNPPPDQQMITLAIHTTQGANPTLAVDGGTAYPMRSSRGVAITGLFPTSYVFCFDGSTNEWIRVPFSAWPGGEVQRAIDIIDQLQGVIDTCTNTDIEIHLYEAGGHLDPPDSSTNLRDYYTAINRDPRMYDLTIQYLQGMKDTGLVKVFNYFTLTYPFGAFGNWGAAEHILHEVDPDNTPKLAALTDFAIAQRTMTVNWNS